MLEVFNSFAMARANSLATSLDPIIFFIQPSEKDAFVQLNSKHFRPKTSICLLITL